MKQSLTNKLKQMEIDLQKLRKVNVSTVQDLEPFEKYHLVERLIEKIVDTAVGINQMILREKFNATIKTAKESFTDLATNGVLNMEFATEISRSVGLRNKIIHEYDQVTTVTLFQAIDICLQQYTEYHKATIIWIDNNYTD
ncbi:MAG: DUF86 domain-containing protein [Chitinophagales bacterium]|nr:DUF86 domain-containing protein [Chitinophagales bacterium]